MQDALATPIPPSGVKRRRDSEAPNVKNKYGTRIANLPARTKSHHAAENCGKIEVHGPKFFLPPIKLPMRPDFVRTLIGLVALVSLEGCAFEAVKPWQRGELARENAQLVADPLENAADEHIYFSKEAANGGQGVAGGGCGCN